MEKGILQIPRRLLLLRKREGERRGSCKEFWLPPGHIRRFPMFLLVIVVGRLERRRDDEEGAASPNRLCRVSAGGGYSYGG